MRRFTTLALLTLAVGPPTLGAQPHDGSQQAASAVHHSDAAAAIVSVMQRAIDHGSAAKSLRLGLASETLAVATEIAPETPTIAWQSEGLDASFAREANATDYLRLGKSFNYPWWRPLDSELRRGHEAWAAAAELAGLLELAADSGKRWLDWAAAESVLALAKARLARIDRALVLQEKRHELGEVAGAEVEQLRLEHARDAASVQRNHARIQSLAATLSARIGGPADSPGHGALVELVARLDPLPANDGSNSADDRGLLAADRARAASVAARSRFRRALAWGRPVAEIEWERVPTLDGVNGFDAFGFNLSVPLPVGKRGRALRAQASVDAEAAVADLENAQRMVEQRRAMARADVEAAERSLASLSPILDRMPATEHSLTEQFRLGAISYLVLIDGLSRLDEVRREAIEAQRGLLAARLELAILAGESSFFPLPALEVEP